MAALQAQCGKDVCLCSFLLLDWDIVKEWLNAAGEFAKLAKRPHKDFSPKQLLVPCKFTTLQEHEACFQQWAVLQLWAGVISTIWIFVLSFIWALSEDLVPMGPVFVNAVFALFLTVFMAYLAWFDVVKKHGCCCFILCCCLGKPNLLATAIVALLFGIVALIQGFQAIGSGYVLPILASLSAIAHGVVLLYLGFEAFMVWRLSVSATVPDTEVVGAAQTVAEIIPDLEASKAQMPVMLGKELPDKGADAVEKTAEKANGEE